MTALKHDTEKSRLELYGVCFRTWLRLSHNVPPRLNCALESVDKFFFSGYSGGALEEALIQLGHYVTTEEITAVLEFGARKYAAWNYTEGMKYSRLLGAFRRHTLAHIRGEEHDPETGIKHLAHATCNVLFLLEYVERGLTEWDDRPTEQKRESTTCASHEPCTPKPAVQITKSRPETSLLLSMKDQDPLECPTSESVAAASMLRERYSKKH